MPTVFEDEIEAQMRAFPGLGRLQAINRIRTMKMARANGGRAFRSTNWVK